MKKGFIVLVAGILCLAVLIVGCNTPQVPEFENEEGLTFVEGFVSTERNGSYVIISRSVLEQGRFETVFVRGASVSFENTATGELVSLRQRNGRYTPPQNFVVAVGEQWFLNIELDDGTVYRSIPEEVLEPVPISELDVTYERELEFREIAGGGSFIPGHRLTVSYEDPPAERNFYYWTYRTFENLRYCETCFEGIFRNRACLTVQDLRLPDYFVYPCDSKCWRIRYPESIAVFADEFSDGRTNAEFPIANLPLYTRENILVEVSQYSIDAGAYDFYRVLKDILENGRGLNAPPPTAPIGNVVNINDPDEVIYGRFTAVAATTSSLFIERERIAEEPLEPELMAIVETTMFFPNPVTSAPCENNRFRTRRRPEGWID